MEDPLARGSVERDGGVHQGLLRRGAVLGIDRSTDTLHQRADSARDGAVACGANDALSVSLLGGCVIGPDESLRC